MKTPSADQQPSVEVKDLVVFDILRESQCAGCGKELPRGEFLFMEDGRPLCLGCADLDHLVCLPRGDTALTRHARKHSSRGVGRMEARDALRDEIDARLKRWHGAPPF